MLQIDIILQTENKKYKNKTFIISDSSIQTAFAQMTLNGSYNCMHTLHAYYEKTYTAKISTQVC